VHCATRSIDWIQRALGTASGIGIGLVFMQLVLLEPTSLRRSA
jgi:hypothetical protein